MDVNDEGSVGVTVSSKGGTASARHDHIGDRQIVIYAF